MRTFAIIDPVDKKTVINVVTDPGDEEIAANPGKYVQTSPVIVAGIGWTWDGTNFTPPKPYPSWVFNAATRQWESPVPYPAPDGKTYAWDEVSRSWKSL